MIEIMLRAPAAALIEKRLFVPGQFLHAPHLLDVEVAQVMRRCVAMERIGPHDAMAALDILADLPLHRHLHHNLLPRVWELRHNLSAYDATYVALAEMLGATLLTRDKRIAGASGHHAQVELV